VMGIGENIIFIHKGRKWWQGDRDGLLRSDNPELNDFIFAGSLMREVKRAMTNGS
jgi:phospholipid/cholesterol/gamma-HCH transport system ATP-binding protein